MNILGVYGFLCEILKDTFEISHKMFESIHRKICILLTFIFVWLTISLNCDIIIFSETGLRAATQHSILDINTCTGVPIHRKICILLTSIFVWFNMSFNCDVISISETDPRTATQDSILDTNAVRCRYDAVIFLTYIHKIHPIALLWIQHPIDVLPQFL